MSAITPPLKGRQRRLWHEWQAIESMLSDRNDITVTVTRRNASDMPVEYDVCYHIRSICGVTNIDCLGNSGVSHEPLFADEFHMRLTLPPAYPSVDAPPQYEFLTMNTAHEPIPHPWHPNIRYGGAFAGRVCINAMDTMASLAWAIDRIAAYLRYDLYHAVNEPPYPEDPRVARWVISEGEPKEWIFFEQPPQHSQ